MKQTLRTAIAVIVASAAFPLLLIIIGGVVYVLGKSDYAQYFITAAWTFTFILPVTIVLGLPAHLIAYRRGATALNKYLIGGLVLGLITVGLIFLSFPTGFKVFKAIGLGSCVGVSSGFLFWLITGKAR